MEWLLNDIHQIWLNREIWLLYGGLIVVGVVIFLMGAFKAVLGNKIHNKLLRKTILSFVSVIMVAPATAIYLVLNTANGLDYFWYLYAFNAIATIVIYWFYENTHIRELLALIGKNTVSRALNAIFGKEPQPVEKTVKTIQEDTKKIVKSSKFDLSKFNEDDLKFL